MSESRPDYTCAFCRSWIDSSAPECPVCGAPIDGPERQGQDGQDEATEAQALCHQGDELRDAGQREAAMKRWDEVATRFSVSTNPKVRWWVAMALSLKGHSLAILNRDDEAVATFDRLIALFGGDTDPEMRDQVYEAGTSRLMSLGQWDEVVARNAAKH